MKTMIQQNYATDFAGACAFFSSIVSSVYGTAQVEYRCKRLKKHKISSVHHGSHEGGGCGRGCYGGHGRDSRGRCGGRGGGGRSGGQGNGNYVNGVNISDPNCNFNPIQMELTQT